MQSDLFSPPPSSTGETIVVLIATVFEIFFQEWKTLMGLGLLYLISVIALTFMIGVLSANIFADKVPIFIQFVLNHVENAGISGVSTLLENYNSNKSHGGSFYPDMSDTFSLIRALAVFVIAAVCVCVFIGSITHTTGEVYAGRSPILKKSLQRGWLRKWPVFAYQFLVSSISLFIVLITFMLPIALDIKHEIDTSDGDMENIDLFNMIVSIAIAFVIINSLLVASIPVMIIENKSAIEAMKRSIILCKGFICFILCTLICWNFARLIVVAILEIIMILSIIHLHLGPFVFVIGQLFINVFIISTTPILYFVLYMHMRVRIEGLDQNQFTNEIESSVPMSETVELNGEEYEALPEDGTV